jgi:excisionase family DNA binding protein
MESDQRALIRHMQVVVTEQHQYIRAALAEVNDQRELRRVSRGFYKDARAEFNAQRVFRREQRAFREEQRQVARKLLAASRPSRPGEPAWMTVPQAARYSGRSKTTILEAIRRKELPARRRGKHGWWHVRREDVDAWMKEGKAQ